ncbi:NYN domain-containing protein [Longimicrobium sp.]|jgi:uncharacterized LabA/DUF88 family protein|uniref:NYN domain-containing protein n=1 Tax=Longimicrobium sp. TaxID=2029185 RepID=UPI002F924C4D
MAKRVAFLVDGFNVYYSLRDVEKLSKAKVKWLDLRKLLSDHLQPIREALGERVEVSVVHYFFAYAYHQTPYDAEVVNRHATYVEALETTGIRVVLSKFKAKDVACSKCGHQWKRHEEKQTDVALGVKLMDSFARDERDAVVLVSGDTDLIPAIQMTRALFPQRKIGVAFPFLRHNTELEAAADFSFKITQKALQRAQFPLTIPLANGVILEKPGSW